MNTRLWQQPTVPIPALALKLCEEAAEVGGEISDSMTRYEHSESYHLARALIELSHVEFIARCLRERMEAQLKENEKRWQS